VVSEGVRQSVIKSIIKMSKLKVSGIQLRANGHKAFPEAELRNLLQTSCSFNHIIKNLRGVGSERFPAHLIINSVTQISSKTSFIIHEGNR
jgi:hypothetical protein